MEKKLPYSYSTFLFPFLVNHEQLNEQLKQDARWEEDYLSSGKKLLREDLPTYQTFQYFNNSARNALFCKDANIVSCWRFTPADGGTYRVTTPDKRDFSLRLNAVRLKVYNTGVAIVVYETEYFPDESCSAEQRHKNVKCINEYGRRVFPEFLPEKPEDWFLCPDKLELIDATGKVLAFDDFRALAVETDRADYYLKKPLRLPDIITDLLPGSPEGYSPAIDDRMFVCSVIMDQVYTNSFIHGIEKGTKGNWRFMTDWEKGCELYAVTNIDATDSTCQNRQLLDKYFDEQLYLRWIECGTIHAVTNHSMVLLTGAENTINSVVNPFLMEYTQMCALTLAQRASLIAFDGKITEAVINERGLLEKLPQLAKDFAVFQGQIMISEITPQIQGIELYQMLQRMLFVDRLEQGIQRGLTNLFEIDESLQAKHQREQDEEENRRERRNSGFFAGIGLLAIASACIDLHDFLDAWGSRFWVGSLAAVSITVIAVGLWCILFPKKQSRKGDKKHER